MIDVKLLRDEPDRIREACRVKNCDPALVDRFLELDGEWRKLTADIDGLRADQKRISAARDIEGGKKNKETIRELEARIAAIEKEREGVWEKVPNSPSEDTPVGKDDSENPVIRTWGEPPAFDFAPKDHAALGEALGIIDTESAGRVTGARFGYLKGDAVLLEFALIQHAMRVLGNESVLREIADRVKPGYPARPFTPVLPPVMIRPEVMQKMARLEPRDERYHIPSDDLYLIGSAEHTLGPLHMDETLAEERLPIRYVGFSTSFRREAGAAGKDTHGILRVHQFDKVEIESFTAPEDGLVEQDFFVAIQEYLVQSLNLPYRVVMCCTGDQGDPDARHIDIETWMPGSPSTGSGQGAYRETHSADYMTDYQARRLATRVKRADGTTVLAHMNDATAFAGRTLIAILENYQTKEGRVVVPEVLRPYVGKDLI